MYRCVSFVKKPTLWCGFLFFTVAILWKHFRGEQFLQHAAQGTDTVTADAVMHPLPLFPTADDSGIAEDSHMVGQGGLTDVQCIQQLTGALFAVVEQFQNLDPVFIPQRFEYISHLSVCAFHGFTSIFLIRIVAVILMFVNI